MLLTLPLCLNSSQATCGPEFFWPETVTYVVKAEVAAAKQLEGPPTPLLANEMFFSPQLNFYFLSCRSGENYSPLTGSGRVIPIRTTEKQTHTQMTGVSK